MNMVRSTPAPALDCSVSQLVHLFPVPHTAVQSWGRGRPHHVHTALPSLEERVVVWYGDWFTHAGEVFCKAGTAAVNVLVITILKYWRMSDVMVHKLSKNHC